MQDEVDFAEMMDHSSPDVTMFSEMEDFDASLSESEDVWLVQVRNSTAVCLHCICTIAITAVSVFMFSWCQAPNH